MSQKEFELWHPEFGAWFRRLCINEKTMRGVMWPGLIVQSPLPIGKTICLCYAENFISAEVSKSSLYIDEHVFFSQLAQVEGTPAYYEALQRISHVEWPYYDNLLDSDHIAFAEFPHEALEYIIRTRSDRYLPTIFSTHKHFSDLQDLLPKSLISPLSELKRINLYPNKHVDHLISKESCYKKEVVA